MKFKRLESIVRMSVRRFIRRHPGSKSFEDDLTQAAWMGLCDALSRFDPTRGALLITFAFYRVHGEMKTLWAKEKEIECRRDLSITDSDGEPIDIPDVEDFSLAPDEISAAKELGARLRADLDHDLAALMFLELQGEPNGSQQRLADELGLSKSWASRLVDRGRRTFQAHARRIIDSIERENALDVPHK